ncbi:fimbrial protein [Moellerella wisconsensis]|uniref:MrfF family protein n=1 Tax=Moellerella wisconsensis ATCC 35017 TaxID=1354267 RepID=A0A0N0ZBW2_9GAMM|nr:fimbrial protein [Moellerella wisconsensis]KPD03594.1 MrfF family protein [Moellerella wisconsensis ATCC 35017]VFS50484.1 putative minor fimbrial subunit StfF [Moellerella wisconsensis]
MNMIRKFCGAILLCSLPSIVFSFAGFLDVKISGEVLARPCTINDGEMITVDFKDVLYNDIENENYIKKIDYSVNCKGAVNPAMRVSIKGVGTLFDDQLLKTSMDDLGVAFKAGSNRFSIKNKINFYYKNPPILYAILVKNSNGGTLPGGPFHANATLQVEYQ